jgi:hypothetical protein
MNKKDKYELLKFCKLYDIDVIKEKTDTRLYYYLIGRKIDMKKVVPLGHAQRIGVMIGSNLSHEDMKRYMEYIKLHFKEHIKQYDRNNKINNIIK